MHQSKIKRENLHFSQNFILRLINRLRCNKFLHRFKYFHFVSHYLSLAQEFFAQKKSKAKISLCVKFRHMLLNPTWLLRKMIRRRTEKNKSRNKTLFLEWTIKIQVFKKQTPKIYVYGSRLRWVPVFLP